MLVMCFRGYLALSGANVGYVLLEISGCVCGANAGCVRL